MRLLLFLCFSNLAGATNAILQLTAVKEPVNGNRYRCVISVASCGSIISTPGILTVNLLPTAFITADPVNKLKPGLLASLTATAAPSLLTNTFAWFRDGQPVGTGNKLAINYTGIGDYTVTVTDAKGCSSTSAVYAVNDSVSNRLFITPNPNNGKFQVIYHSTRLNVLHRLLTVYDGKGTRVWTKDFIVSGAYQPMNVDLTNLARGIYYIQLGDFNGKPLASGNVFIY